MKVLELSRYASCVSIAAAMLAGCGGSQPIDAPGAIPQSRATDKAPFGSPRKAGDAVFATAAVDGCTGAVLLWTFPTGHFKKCVHGVYGEGLCSDKSGDVWVAEGGGTNAMYKLDHQGTLTRIFLDRFGTPISCAVDATTGDIAVIELQSTVRIFQSEKGSGIGYQTNLARGSFCGYDTAGNLFVDGVTASRQGELLELPKGAKSFQIISLNQSITGDGAVQWDGKYMAVEAGRRGRTAIIDRISISGSSGTVVSTTQLMASKLRSTPAVQFWIQGNTILRPTGWQGTAIGEWAYPAGGAAKHIIRRAGSGRVHIARGVTVSLAPSR